MIFQILLKILFFYFLFVVVRGIYRSYKTISILQNGGNPFNQGGHQKHQGQTGNFGRKSQAQSDPNTVEAEYRVISEDD